MNPPPLEVRELGVALDGQQILAGVGLSVGAGDWLAVVGPNGAGKTTLLRCIAGASPYDGTVLLEGREARGLSRADRARRVAVVPQHPVFPEGMTVADYVLLGRTPHVRLFGFERHTDWLVVEALISQLGLEAFAGRRITTLSGGERQRAVIARSLAQEPSVLLLDEPTTALDLGRQHEVLSLVDDLRLARGLAVISALHDLTLAGQYAERFLLLHEGRPLASGTAAEVLDAELLERCYGTPVAVIEADGTTVVVPPRPDRAGGAAPVSDRGGVVGLPARLRARGAGPGGSGEEGTQQDHCSERACDREHVLDATIPTGASPAVRPRAEDEEGEAGRCHDDRDQGRDGDREPGLWVRQPGADHQHEDGRDDEQRGNGERGGNQHEPHDTTGFEQGRPPGEGEASEGSGGQVERGEGNGVHHPGNVERLIALWSKHSKEGEGSEGEKEHRADEGERYRPVPLSTCFKHVLKLCSWAGRGSSGTRSVGPGRR